MGGNSTLQSAALADDARPTSFDLKSWQGLTELLKVGKESLSDPDAYAEFRNLVLQYAQRGGDVELKGRIDAIVATFGTATPAQPEGVPDANPQPERKQFSLRRSAPTFGVSVATPSEATAPEPAPQTPPPPPSAPAPAVETAAVPPPVVSPEPVPPTPPPAPDTAQKFTTQDEYKTRIAEIKRSVNTRFANPVALMAVHDGLGKQYMGALLTALKASGAGATGIDAAMVALESAYDTLMQADAAPAKEVEPTPAPDAPVVPPPVPEPEPIPEPVTIPEPEPIREPAPQPVSVPVVELPLTPEVPEAVAVPAEQNVAPVIEVPISESEPLPQSVEAPAEEPLAVEQSEDVVEPPSRGEILKTAFQKTDDAISSVVGSVHRAKHSAADTLASLMEEVPQTMSRAPYVEPAPAPSQPVADTVPSDEEIVTGYEAALHDEEQSEPEEKKATANKWTLKELAALDGKQKISEAGINPTEFAVKQSELSSPEITTTLDTLLSKWSIFSGSGIFGIGPDGMEHPLYLKLAPLTMGEVIAGRWEGSNPKVTKAIKEYVDAWRHEQSITYTLNETFEHYLRRVSQRILRRQNS